MIAGFGWTDAASATFGQRFFAPEAVVDIEADDLVVASPKASSGACLGDSGGPVFAMIDGQPVVLGTLEDGDSSCLGRDYFVRCDRLGAWLLEVRKAWAAD